MTQQAGHDGVQPAVGRPPRDARRLSVEREFAAFFNESYASLLSFATWWGKSVHDAEDAVATVLTDMYGRWTDIRDPAAYARRAVTWNILKMRRDSGGGRCVPSDPLPDRVVVSPDFDRLESAQWVDDLLAELPPAQYAVLSRFVDGLSIKEISDELRKTQSTVRQNYKLARDRLRPLVEEYDRRRPAAAREQKARENR
jgi:RNA polymerase sigma factor (sigma-70 family)